MKLPELTLGVSSSFKRHKVACPRAFKCSDYLHPRAYARGFKIGANKGYISFYFRLFFHNYKGPQLGDGGGNKGTVGGNGGL